MEHVHPGYEESTNKALEAFRTILRRLTPTERPERGCWAYVREPELHGLDLSYMQAAVAFNNAWIEYRNL